MSEQISLKELTKRELRSILLSTTRSLTLDQVEEDYKRLVGYHIRYREMGYNTLSDFIQDIPDVVSCRLMYGKMVVTGVADSATQHIASLVARQKKPRVKRGQGRTYVNSRFVSSAPRNIGPSMAERSQSESLRLQNEGRMDMNQSYNIFRGQVKELLFANPTGILLKQFESVFARRFKCPLPVQRLGYRTLTALLESMPDILSFDRPSECDDVVIVSKFTPRRQHSQSFPTGIDAIFIYI